MIQMIGAAILTILVGVISTRINAWFDARTKKKTEDVKK